MPDAVRAQAEAMVDAALAPQLELGDLVGLPATPRQVVADFKRAGRPVGSRNRRSEEVARFVIEQLGDPLLHQAAVAVMSVEQLVAAGLTVKEALEERRLAAAVVLPYLHRRQPVQVDVSSHRVVHLTISDPGAPAPDASDAFVVEVVQNQEVDDGADDAV